MTLFLSGLAVRSKAAANASIPITQSCDHVHGTHIRGCKFLCLMFRPTATYIVKPVLMSRSVEIWAKGVILATYSYAQDLSLIARNLSPPLVSSSLMPCLSSDLRGGKYTESKLSSGPYPDSKLMSLRQMAQLDHGDALWFVALRYLMYTT